MVINWNEYERLKNESHLTDKNICKILMIHQNTLVQEKKKRGYKPHETKIKVNWNLYYDYKEKGLTDKRIAKLMNLNPSTLCQKKKEIIAKNVSL